jgi:hypothetical protein
MATKEVTLKLDQWDIQSELVFIVDDEKFTEALASEINCFWTSSRRRLDECGGSVIKAALKLYAVECFALVAFNNFKDEEWVMVQFDWRKGKGVEGFPCFEDAGLVLKSIENWHVEFDHVTFADE